MKKEVYYLKCPSCKEPAFYFKEKPYKGMLLKSDKVFTEGGKVFAEDIIRCQFCHIVLYTHHLIEKNLSKKEIDIS